MSLDASEVEFLAEKQLVKIVPNFNHDRIFLIAGDVGPFRAGLPAEVPLWLALNLQHRHKCRIIPPEWLDVDRLEAVREEELQSQFFTPMPDQHYMAVAQMVMGAVREELPRLDEIKTIIKDIWDIRQAKLRSSVDAFVRSEGTHAKLDHLTLLEINMVRPFLPHALDQLHRLRRGAQGGAAATSQN